MKLTELKPSPGSRNKLKRVGRGIASGMGKTSTRGHRGQGQRSGYKRRYGFEGGQTPLFRRLPKIHNFDYVKRREWVVVNVGDLSGLPAGTIVTPESLVEHKILKSTSESLRVLANGELSVKLTVKAHHISEGAKAKIEKAGGSVEIIPPAERTRAVKPITRQRDKAKAAAAAEHKTEAAKKPAKSKKKEESED